MPSFCEVAGFRLSLTAVNYIALEMPVAGRAWTIMANNAALFHMIERGLYSTSLPHKAPEPRSPVRCPNPYARPRSRHPSLAEIASVHPPGAPLLSARHRGERLHLQPSRLRLSSAAAGGQRRSRGGVLSRGGSPLFPYPEYRALRDRNQSLDGLAVSEPEESDLSFEGNAMLIGAEPVSANYAAVLGARTSLGRWFTREDEPAAVISYHAWQQLFHGDPGVLGKTIRSESHAYTVVGVAPSEFAGIYAPLRIDLWVPFRYWAGNDADNRRAMVFGCLKRGVGVSQAAAELNAVDRSEEHTSELQSLRHLV